MKEHNINNKIIFILVLGVIDTPTGDGECGLILREVGTVVDLGDPGLSPTLPQRDPSNQRTIRETDAKPNRAAQHTWW